MKHRYAIREAYVRGSNIVFNFPWSENDREAFPAFVIRADLDPSLDGTYIEYGENPHVTGVRVLVRTPEVKRKWDEALAKAKNFTAPRDVVPV